MLNEPLRKERGGFLRRLLLETGADDNGFQAVVIVCKHAPDRITLLFWRYQCEKGEP
jgi:hypothetical protein